MHSHPYNNCSHLLNQSRMFIRYIFLSSKLSFRHLLAHLGLAQHPSQSCNVTVLAAPPAATKSPSCSLASACSLVTKSVPHVFSFLLWQHLHNQFPSLEKNCSHIFECNTFLKTDLTCHLFHEPSLVYSWVFPVSETFTVL